MLLEYQVLHSRIDVIFLEEEWSKNPFCIDYLTATPPINLKTTLKFIQARVVKLLHAIGKPSNYSQVPGTLVGRESNETSFTVAAKLFWTEL